MFELMYGLNDDLVSRDTEALFAHVDADPAPTPAASAASATA